MGGGGGGYKKKRENTNVLWTARRRCFHPLPNQSLRPHHTHAHQHRRVPSTPPRRPHDTVWYRRAAESDRCGPAYLRGVDAMCSDLGREPQPRHPPPVSLRGHSPVPPTERPFRIVLPPVGCNVCQAAEARGDSQERCGDAREPIHEWRRDAAVFPAVAARGQGSVDGAFERSGRRTACDGGGSEGDVHAATVPRCFPTAESTNT